MHDLVGFKLTLVMLINPLLDLSMVIYSYVILINQTKQNSNYSKRVGYVLLVLVFFYRHFKIKGICSGADQLEILKSLVPSIWCYQQLFIARSVRLA